MQKNMNHAKKHEFHGINTPPNLDFYSSSSKYKMEQDWSIINLT